MLEDKLPFKEYDNHFKDSRSAIHHDLTFPNFFRAVHVSRFTGVFELVDSTKQRLGNMV